MEYGMSRRRFLMLIGTAAYACGIGTMLDGCSSSSSTSSASTAASGSSWLSEDVVPNYAGTLNPTFSLRSGDSYTIGAYVKDGQVVGDYSYLKDFVAGDSGALSMAGLSIDAQGSGFCAVALQGSGNDGSSAMKLSNVDITLSDDDGCTNCSDFTGLGTAVMASGVSEDAHSQMTLDNVTITTTGFLRDGLVVNDYTDAVITNSSITVNGANPMPGGDAYASYHSSANQAYMMSPPWVLGIAGGARAMNMLGTRASLSVIDSSVEAGAWAVLSVDSCKTPQMNVVNSELKIAHADTAHGLSGGADLFGYKTPYGSGYGTYATGSPNESFYGTTFSDVTYATIMTGTGELYYGPSKSGLALKNAKGDTVYTYNGQARDTVVNGVWGLMDHQGGTAQLDGGSTWNTEEATILKKGTNSSTYSVTGAQLNPASGIIFQMMDDDDGYGTSGTGGDTMALTCAGTAWGSPTFSGGWYEVAGSAGLPSALGTLATGGSVTSTVNLSDGTYEGNLYNGAGSGSGVEASGLAVSLSGATLSGAISSVQTVHGIPYTAAATAYLDKLAAGYGAGVAYQGGTSGPNSDGTYTVKYALLDKSGAVTAQADAASYIQLLEFTCKEYYLLGHVIDFPSAGATVEVTVKNASAWNVTDDSHLTYLSIEEGCTVTVLQDATLTVGDTVLAGTVAAGTYGTKTAATASSSGGAMAAGAAATGGAAPSDTGGTVPSGMGGGTGAGGTPPSGTGGGNGSGGASSDFSGAGVGGTPPDGTGGSSLGAPPNGGTGTSGGSSSSSSSSTAAVALDTSHPVWLTVSKK